MCNLTVVLCAVYFSEGGCIIMRGDSKNHESEVATIYIGYSDLLIISDNGNFPMFGMQCRAVAFKQLP